MRSRYIGVTSTVVKEMQGGAPGATFSVNDLRAHVSDLGKIGDSVAWEISYKTSKSDLVSAGDIVRPGSIVAWEISYKTSKAGFDKGSIG
jgi:hypothetical protein